MGWVTQSVKLSTLDFGSGHDLMAGRQSPTKDSVRDVKPA